MPISIKLNVDQVNTWKSPDNNAAIKSISILCPLIFSKSHQGLLLISIPD
jgi:hypothetical protein